MSDEGGITSHVTFLYPLYAGNLVLLTRIERTGRFLITIRLLEKIRGYQFVVDDVEPGKANFDRSPLLKLI